MASLLYILIGILSAVALFLLYKYLKLRSELRKISDQLESLVEEDSEKMLDITFIDSELERLAGLFNRYNDKQRQIVASAMKDEEFL
ncbi:MAG: two-component sensor histidine kinase, partial [Clostridiales bacterium]|nr:two-component sensor histidine kinase [Clostridiales bacterium]